MLKYLYRWFMQILLKQLVLRTIFSGGKNNKAKSHTLFEWTLGGKESNVVSINFKNTLSEATGYQPLLYTIS